MLKRGWWGGGVGWGKWSGDRQDTMSRELKTLSFHAATLAKDDKLRVDTYVMEDVKYRNDDVG